MSTVTTVTSAIPANKSPFSVWDRFFTLIVQITSSPFALLDTLQVRVQFWLLTTVCCVSKVKILLFDITKQTTLPHLNQTQKILNLVDFFRKKLSTNQFTKLVVHTVYDARCRNMFVWFFFDKVYTENVFTAPTMELWNFPCKKWKNFWSPGKAVKFCSD